MGTVEKVDIALVGAGAAGLTAAIWAGRTYPALRINLLDGAQKLGAKILVSGGGRCNVTHDEVDVQAYAGSSRNAIKKVLRRFDVPQTIDFFRELGVELKREETGKLFPVTDSARTVLNAMISGVHQAKVMLKYPRRVEAIEKCDDRFVISGSWGELHAQRLILATGGKSLPKTGSDGKGLALAKSLGHTITEHVFPALVPLTLPRDHFITELSGLTLPATLELRSSTGKKLIAFTNSTLCTHFGLSGPSALDFSRYFLAAQFEDSGVIAVINWLPDKTSEQFEREVQTLGRTSVSRWLAQLVPERLARALCEQSRIEPGVAADQLTREQRKTLTQLAVQCPLPITGSRGFNFAEVTAGGIPLSEIHLETMESRVCPGLYLCGEICDVDGRIGGYNFQWAWASGYVAGISAGAGL